MPNCQFTDGTYIDDPLVDALIPKFQDHVYATAHSSIDLYGQHIETGRDVRKSIPVIYRTDVRYKKALLAKLYSLDKWYGSLPVMKRAVTMVTLTT